MLEYTQKGVILVPNSEQILIEKSKNGDVASFEKLISQYQVYVYNIAYRTLGHEEDAKDAAQDALIKVFKNISQYTGDAQFSTWLYRIVVNTCKDCLRKKSSLKETTFEGTNAEGEGTLWELPASDMLHPEKQLERKEIQQKIHSALDQLPEANKTVVILKDISHIEDCSVGTVKSRINRGRKYLRELLQVDPDFVREGGI
jgi:RNA polymerase sigma-70 factor (ECF subfamily)